MFIFHGSSKLLIFDTCSVTDYERDSGGTRTWAFTGTAVAALKPMECIQHRKT
jgi:hypothetical protein